MNETNYGVDFDALPFAFGRPALSGRLRVRPEDFFVEELLGFDVDDDGPHRLLWIEKTAANTEWVARQLARIVKCRVMDVGFCGMKDRNAVTRQWFSVPAPKDDVDLQAIDIEGVRILSVHAHRRKLRRGAHAANRFVLTLRDVEGDDDLEMRVARVREQGVPNYFGPQRFGQRGDNVIRAIDGARGGIYLSAARSFLCNAVLAERLRRGDWNVLLPGEAVQLDGSGSFFIAEAVDDVLAGRLAEFDIHPSGPLWGKGELPSRHAVADLEKAIAADMSEVTQLLEASGMRHERRALRLPVRSLDAQRPTAAQVVIAFELSPGAFATSVLRELINASEARDRTTEQGENHA